MELSSEEETLRVWWTIQSKINHNCLTARARRLLSTLNGSLLNKSQFLTAGQWSAPNDAVFKIRFANCNFINLNRHDCIKHSSAIGDAPSELFLAIVNHLLMLRDMIKWKTRRTMLTRRRLEEFPRKECKKRDAMLIKATASEIQFMTFPKSGSCRIPFCLFALLSSIFFLAMQRVSHLHFCASIYILNWNRTRKHPDYDVN